MTDPNHHHHSPDLSDAFDKVKSRSKRGFLHKWWLWTKYKFLRLNGTPHSIAVGLSWGTAVSFLPILGVHIALACFLSWRMRGNLIAAVLGTLAGNPWTTPLMFWFDYKFGYWLLEISGHALQAGSASDLVGDPTALLTKALHIYLPMLIGGVLTMVLGYPLFYRLCLPLAKWLKQYQIVRRERGHQRRKARRQKQQ